MMRRPHVAMVEVLRHLPAPLFTTADASKLVSDDNVFLYRAGRKGYVQKLVNRIYWNVLFSPQMPAVELVACFARQPSYISCEWALNYHGVLLQVPTVCTAVTLHGTSGRRNRIIFAGYVIEYSRISEHLYLPEQILAREGFVMATPEKALLDMIYLRHRVLPGDELELEALDVEKLKALASLYPAGLGRRLEQII
jgi:hypothetical protein